MRNLLSILLILAGFAANAQIQSYRIANGQIVPATPDWKLGANGDTLVYESHMVPHCNNPGCLVASYKSEWKPKHPKYSWSDDTPIKRTQDRAIVTQYQIETILRRLEQLEKAAKKP